MVWRPKTNLEGLGLDAQGRLDGKICPQVLGGSLLSSLTYFLPLAPGKTEPRRLLLAPAATATQAPFFLRKEITVDYANLD